MRRVSGWGLILGLAIMAIPRGSQAEARFGLEGFGAFNTYRMKDVNHEIDGLRAFGGRGFDAIRNQVGGGAGVRCWLDRSWLLALRWEPLYAKTQGQFDVLLPDSTVGSFDLDLNLDAGAVQLDGARFLSLTRTLGLGIGAGVGYYKVIGHATLSGARVRRPPHNQLQGSHVGFQFTGLLEWSLNRNVAVSGTSGYRIARIRKVEAIGDLNLASREADYSGFLGRLGLTFYIPTGH